MSQLPKMVSNLQEIFSKFFFFWYMKNNLTRSIFTDNCNINQTCMKVQNCPYTKQLLKDARTTNDAKEKEKNNRAYQITDLREYG